MVKDNEIYCPVCQKTLHENIKHDDDDIAALDNKMQ